MMLGDTLLGDDAGRYDCMHAWDTLHDTLYDAGRYTV